MENFRLGPGRQDVVAFGREALEYPDYVLGGLARAEDNLGETTSNLAVMVNAREAEVLERQMPEFFDCVVHANLVVLDFFQQFF
jgi:hypothetical protein